MKLIPFLLAQFSFGLNNLPNGSDLLNRTLTDLETVLRKGPVVGPSPPDSVVSYLSGSVASGSAVSGSVASGSVVAPDSAVFEPVVVKAWDYVHWTCPGKGIAVEIDASIDPRYNNVLRAASVALIAGQMVPRGPPLLIHVDPSVLSSDGHGGSLLLRREQDRGTGIDKFIVEGPKNGLSRCELLNLLVSADAYLYTDGQRPVCDTPLRPESIVTRPSAQGCTITTKHIRPPIERWATHQLPPQHHQLPPQHHPPNDSRRATDRPANATKGPPNQKRVLLPVSTWPHTSVLDVDPDRPLDDNMEMEEFCECPPLGKVKPTLDNSTAGFTVGAMGAAFITSLLNASVPRQEDLLESVDSATLETPDYPFDDLPPAPDLPDPEDVVKNLEDFGEYLDIEVLDESAARNDDEDAVLYGY